MSLKGRSCWEVNIRMDEAEKLSLEAIGRFVAASEEIRFEAEDRQQLYGWVERVLVEQEYAQQGKAARGLVRRYIEKMTGLSRAQVTRLIARYTASGRVAATVYRRRRFPQLYTRADIELLASVDEAHETLSGPATRRILEREFEVYGKPEYARLATISVAHLYNLRQQPALPRAASELHQDAAHGGVDRRAAQASAAGPARLSAPGYGASGRSAGGGEKGVYHINAVDEVTQWQVVGATPRISEAYLEPVLETHAASVSLSHPGLPHRQRLGVHQQNRRPTAGKTAASNRPKAGLGKSGDNGLVETKNGAIIRKHIGYGYIDARPRRSPSTTSIAST